MTGKQHGAFTIELRGPKSVGAHYNSVIAKHEDGFIYDVTVHFSAGPQTKEEALALVESLCPSLFDVDRWGSHNCDFIVSRLPDNTAYLKLTSTEIPRSYGQAPLEQP